MYLVTGGTGKTGSQTIHHLLAKGAPVRAFVRNEEKAAPLKEKGAELFIGDIGDADAVAKAMDGVEKVMLTLPNGPNEEKFELGVLEAAKAAGVKHLVYLSSTESNPENTRRIPQVHVRVSQAVKDSGVPWTVMRPNFFMQNILAFARTMKPESWFTFPAGDGTAAMCDVRDVGEVAAILLTESDKHIGQQYDLTGPDILSMHDVARLLSEELGREITYKPQSLEDFHAVLSKVLPSEWHIDGVVELMEEMQNTGGLNYTTETMGEILGRPPCSLKQFIHEHRAAFE
jgi:NAD(P)H dehydrogenase (quinone)